MSNVAHFQAIDVLVVIATSTTLSETVNTPEYQEGSFMTPAALTSTGVLFQVSLDGVTFATVKTEAAYADIASKVIAVDKIYPIPAEVLLSPFWRFVFGTPEVADRTIKVLLKGAK